MPEISIIIRTKNEERWIRHCLTMIYKQSFQDFEVVIVDNNSQDHTLELIKNFRIDNLLKIDNFLPGLALNLGIRASSGRYIVCISAHCVPKDKYWLENLRKNFDKHRNIAGVYGGQLPVNFTSPIDKRDLLIVFGRDYRIQKKDFFFHNANSMIPREIWDKFPFDEHVSNIEDRVWGKKVIESGYCLAYDPEAAVYHYHGLHQGNDAKRAEGVVSILDTIESTNVNNLPETMLPGNANVIAVLPIGANVLSNSEALMLVKNTINELNQSEFITAVYLVSDENVRMECPNSRWVNRRNILNVEDMAIDQILQSTLPIIEGDDLFPDLILYVNYEYLYRPKGIFDKLIQESLQNGLDTVFPAYIDYGHYWYRGVDGELTQTDESMKSRNHRSPTYRALYGLGTVTCTHLIRKGKLVGEKVGIIPIENVRAYFRLNDLHLPNT